MPKVPNLDKYLVFVLLFSILLPVFGAISNVTVVSVNGGMPVDHPAIDASDRFNHHTLTDDSKLTFLADIFIVDFPIIEHKLVKRWGLNVNYPVEGGLNAISIGDIFIWLGTALTMVLLPLILLRLAFLLIFRRK